MLDRIADRAGEAIENLGQRMQGEETYSKLYVKPPQVRNWFGFGRKVVVPNDQIHIVSAAGIHSIGPFLSKQTVVYGADPTPVSPVAGQDTPPPRKNAGIMYKMNNLTSVIAMKTITFLVSVSGANGQGVNVLDSNHVSYRVSAHVVAKLDENKADIAAKRVGNDIDSLIITIREVTEAELADAAASMTLSEVLKKAQVLAERAKIKVDATLQDLGYTLVLLKVSDLGGDAYQKLVEQANAEVERTSTIEINRSQLATAQSNQERARTEAEVNAQTLRVTEQQRLEANRDVETTKLGTAEELALRQHDLTLTQAERNQAAAVVQQGVALKQVTLDQEVDLAQTQRKAIIAAKERELADALALAAETAEAARLKLVQAEQLAREADESAAQLELKSKEEAAEADRAKAAQLTRAEAEAQALQLKTEAETSAALLKANRTAEAATKEAAAELERAKARRAIEAAPGLALADVEAQQVKTAADRVAVTKAQGLAEAAVLEARNAAELAHQKGLRDIEIAAQKQLADLYASNGALVELERMKLEFAHTLEVARLENEARVAMMAALAPHMNLQLIGDGGKVSQIMAQVMTLGAALHATGDQVPFVGNLLHGASNGNGHSEANGIVASLPAMLAGFVPYITSIVKGMEPRVFTTLTVSQMLDRLAPVVKGEGTLLQAIDGLRQDAHFQVIGNVPVAPFLAPFGITVADTATDDSVVAALAE